MKTVSQRMSVRHAAALMLSILGATTVSAAPALAQAKSAVALESRIEVELKSKDTGGAEVITYGDPARGAVVPGDKLRFSIHFANTTNEPASALSVTNPIPTAVEFVSVDESWALLSVDGGKSFGALADLTVTVSGADGATTTRAATPSDVTHIKWKLDRPLGPQEKGSLRFYGVVR